MHRKTADLRPHPDNLLIYGDVADPKLIESVRVYGILSPLLITPDGRVISGHRRLGAARHLGLDDVPVQVFPNADELLIRETLIHSNVTRTKTKEQIGREAKALLEIESEKAARKQKEAAATGGKATRQTPPKWKGGKPKPAVEASQLPHVPVKVQANLPEPSPEVVPVAQDQQARDRVGEQLRISGKNVDKLVAVVDRIDELEQAGAAAKAEQLRATLEQESIHAAYKRRDDPLPIPSPQPSEAAPASVPIPILQQDRSAAASLPLFADARHKFAELTRLVSQIASTPGGADLRKQLGTRQGEPYSKALAEVAALLHASTPVAFGCASCDGTLASCPCCAGLGWVTRRVWKQLDDAARLKLEPIGRT